uniref:Uncharacterized protein n=1 Tax=Anguilla anguilla TaxID=7936 RepID=A0A0E9TGU9_ANGAN
MRYQIMQNALCNAMYTIHCEELGMYSTPIRLWW